LVRALESQQWSDDGKKPIADEYTHCLDALGYMVMTLHPLQYNVVASRRFDRLAGQVGFS
jgi:hypothetical protein